MVVALVAGLIGWAVAPSPRSYTVSEAMLTVLSGPAGDEPVTLDTSFYVPKSASARHPVPAILLAHGFGGTKASVAEDAAEFADRGYAVLTYSARGMGRSGGLIHLNSPDYEVRDAQRLLDWLAARPEVQRDADGDPRVGVVGGSYGGALALMLAGVDARVDAIVPMISLNEQYQLHTVVIRNKDNKPITRDTWLIYRDSLLELSVVRAFVDFLKSRSMTDYSIAPHE